jgi:transcriptional regulator with XRE-family HTH domain
MDMRIYLRKDLRDFLEEKNIALKEFAETIGLTGTALGLILKGVTKNPYPRTRRLMEQELSKILNKRVKMTKENDEFYFEDYGEEIESALNEREKSILELFRQVDSETQGYYLEMLKSIIKAYK